MEGGLEFLKLFRMPEIILLGAYREGEGLHTASTVWNMQVLKGAIILLLLEKPQRASRHFG